MAAFNQNYSSLWRKKPIKEGTTQDHQQPSGHKTKSSFCQVSTRLFFFLLLLVLDRLNWIEYSLWIVCVTWNSNSYKQKKRDNINGSFLFIHWTLNSFWRFLWYLNVVICFIGHQNKAKSKSQDMAKVWNIQSQISESIPVDTCRNQLHIWTSVCESISILEILNLVKSLQVTLFFHHSLCQMHQQLTNTLKHKNLSSLKSALNLQS